MWYKQDASFRRFGELQPNKVRRLYKAILGVAKLWWRNGYEKASMQFSWTSLARSILESNHEWNAGKAVWTRIFPRGRISGFRMLFWLIQVTQCADGKWFGGGVERHCLWRRHWHLLIILHEVIDAQGLAGPTTKSNKVDKQKKAYKSKKFSEGSSSLLHSSPA